MQIPLAQHNGSEEQHLDSFMERAKLKEDRRRLKESDLGLVGHTTQTDCKLRKDDFQSGETIGMQTAVLGNRSKPVLRIQPENHLSDMRKIVFQWFIFRFHIIFNRR